MKTCLPLFLLLLLSSLNAQLPAQRNHFIQPDFDTKVLASAQLENGNLLVVTGAANYWFFGYEEVWLTCFNQNGEILWNKSGEFGFEVVISAKVIPLAQNNFLLHVERSGCDFGYPDIWGLYNQSGELKWSGTELVDQDPIQYPVLPFDENAFIVQSTILEGFYHVIGFDGENVSFDGLVDTIPEYDQSYVFHPAGDYILRQGNSKLIQCKKGLAPIREIAFDHTIVDYKVFANNGLAVLFRDSLKTLDSNWVELHNTVLGKHGLELATTHGRLIVKTDDASAQKLRAYDSNLQVIAEIAGPVAVADPHVSGFGENFFVFGTSFPQKQNKALHFNTLPANSLKFDSSPDLSLVDIRFLDTIRYSPVQWGGGNYWSIDFGGVLLTVRNTGLLPVDNFTVKLRADFCPSVCSGEINYALVSNSGDILMPGAERALEFFGDLKFECTSPKSELCFWVNGPDALPDAEPENNRLCKNFSALLGNHEAFGRPMAIPVFPNPTTGMIFFPAMEESVQFSVFDVQGRLMKSGKTDEAQLDCAALPSGLYQLLLRMGNGQVRSGRFVKE